MDTDALVQEKDGIEDDGVLQIEPMSSYWAACPTEDIAKEAQAKVDKYYTYVVSSNLVELWRRAYRAYYGMKQNVGATGWGVFDIGQLVPAGDQGEIVRVKVNHFANLCTHQFVMTVAQRPALECRAVNSDAAALVSAQLGDGVIEYTMREKKLERNYFTAVETGIVLSEGYIVLDWDATAGRQYGVGPNGAALFDGDPKALNFTPFQMIKDVYKNSDEEQNWYITHSKRNRYDLMAKYPHLAGKLALVGADTQTQNNRTFADPSKIIASTSFGSQESDDIPYMTLYHKVTDAMPHGRYTIFVNGDICLFDGPMPFRDLPVYRLAPKSIIGTPFGWTTAFDILGLQELLDKLYTIVATNIMGAGGNVFWSPPGNDLEVSQLGQAQSLIESVTKPEVLQLLRTPAEVYNHINKIEQVMGLLMGINDINRGDIPSADMSGSAMAFMASQALTFNSGLQVSANQLLESMGTGLINLLQDFAATPRLAVIAGKQNRPQMKMFKGEDLRLINNVVCDATSALSKTTAGKLTIADNLLKAGLVKTAEEYLTLIKTGQAEPLTRAPVMTNILIQRENEWLLQGKKPIVLRTDKHAQHLQEHDALLASPEVREDGKLVTAVLEHMAEHERLQQLMQQTDPAFLAATGQPPLPFPPPPAPPQAAPGGPSPAPSAQIAAAVNPTAPAAQKAAEVRQPNMPELPRGADPQTQAAYAQLKGA